MAPSSTPPLEGLGAAATGFGHDRLDFSREFRCKLRVSLLFGSSMLTGRGSCVSKVDSEALLFYNSNIAAACRGGSVIRELVRCFPERSKLNSGHVGLEQPARGLFGRDFAANTFVDIWVVWFFD